MALILRRWEKGLSSGRRAQRWARWLLAGLLLALPVGSVGCDDNKDSAAADDDKSDEGDKKDQKKSKSKSKKHSKDDAAGKPANESDIASGIKVDIKDFQLFHPFSKKRSLLASNEDDDYSTRKLSEHYGVGVVLEATNNTGRLLRNAWFDGELRFVSAKGTVSCQFEVKRLGSGYWTPKTNFLSYAPQLNDKPGRKKSDWRNEATSINESPWRPGERIRMLARKSYCATAALADESLERIEGELTVKALPQFVDRFESEFEDGPFDLQLVGDMVRIHNKQSGRLVSVPVVDQQVKSSRDAYVTEVVTDGELNRDGATKLKRVRTSRSLNTWGHYGIVKSAPVTLTLPVSALTLQRVKSPDGNFIHAAGNVAIFAADDKVKRVDLSRLGLDMLTVERQDLPAQAPEVAFVAKELSGKVTAIDNAHFADNTALSKGRHQVSITWELKLNSGDIDGRLRADVDAADAKVKDAQAKVEAAGEDEAARRRRRSPAPKRRRPVLR